ncbi:MAG TPA: GNAT family N-acetyltransferase [Candidatus Cloacimonadota bacterium]|nr:GNAT family N-acetyltransferase [Candidatus Cloacimonadota bacterium]
MKKKTIWTANIRLCTTRDLKGIQEISDLTWDGDDYLGRIAKQWIQDGHFYIAEYKGKVVGTDKITLLPNRIAWLEGLRVHPDFQKHGIGKQLSSHAMNVALQLKKDGIVQDIEFCTYYKNKESIRMSEQIGFKVVDRLYTLTRYISKRMQEPQQVPIPAEELRQFGPYLPWGWKSVRNSVEGRKWIQEHAQGYRIGDVFFYIGGLEPIAIFPHLDEQILLTAMPALNYLSKERQGIEILIHSTHPELIPMLKKHRFCFWHKPEEPNMLIYRLAE